MLFSSSTIIAFQSTFLRLIFVCFASQQATYDHMTTDHKHAASSTWKFTKHACDAKLGNGCQAAVYSVV